MFEAFARRLPAGRRYGVVAGTGRLLEAITRFRFTDAELDWLRAADVVHPSTLDWLADYRFSGNIWGYREGEAYFPGSPLLIVNASFAEGVILETLILSVLNSDSAVASAAARMVSVALGRPLAEMGSRRTNEYAAVATARAAYIAGFGATSNLEAGRTWGVPTMGTAAHSFTLLHDTEEAAFRAQVAALGARHDAARRHLRRREGRRDRRARRRHRPGRRAHRLRRPAVGRGRRFANSSTGSVPSTPRITVTSDLDEYLIGALSGSPVDAYGVGTSVATGSGAPTAGMVYKLVARRGDDGEWVSVAKASAEKVSVGGRKTAVRRIDSTRTAREEIVYLGDGPDGEPEGTQDESRERPLQATLMRDGVADRAFLGAEGTRAAREHRALVMQELPIEAFRLGAGRGRHPHGLPLTRT